MCNARRSWWPKLKRLTEFVRDFIEEDNEMISLAEINFEFFCPGETLFWSTTRSNPIHQRYKTGINFKLYRSFLWMGFNCLKATEPLWGEVYFLLLSPLFTFKSPGGPGVLISLTSEGWKAESILEPPSGFEPGSPGIGIQLPIH